jgi:hypothetical protein
MFQQRKNGKIGEYSKSLLRSWSVDFGYTGMMLVLAAGSPIILLNLDAPFVSAYREIWRVVCFWKYSAR